MNRLSVISSFPRSGNTWVRFMVATAMLGVRPSSSELNDTIPDIHKKMPDGAGERGNLVVKVHCLPDVLPNYVNHHFGIDPRTIEMVVVHIIRNPFDAAVSNLRYLNLEQDKIGYFFEHYIDPSLGYKPYLQGGMGTWVSNNEAWLRFRDQASIRVEILKYEDLLERPVECLGAILEAFRITPVLPLERVVELCSAENLRAAENAEVETGKAGLFKKHADNKPGTRFINEATTGTYRGIMDEAMIRYGLQHAGPILQRYGYDLSQFHT
jgi:hypothetical protein